MSKAKTSSLHSVPSKSTAGQRIRREKIANIRQELTRGKYDVNERLSAALDRILEDIGASQHAGIDDNCEECESQKTGDVMNEKAGQQRADANKTRILVVDDHPLVHHGLVRLINEEPDLAVCAEAESTRRSLEILEKQQMDLAIVNISLDSSDSIGFAEEARLQYPSLSVLTFCVPAYDELLYLKNVLKEGGVGHIVNQKTTEQIMTSLRYVQSLLRSGVFGVTIRVEVKRSVSHDNRIN